MKKISDSQLLNYGIIIASCFALAFILRICIPWSTKLENWAHAATYLGLSFSIISIVLIYITYRSQVKMSAVLQFESTFFQWHQIHISLYEDLQYDINLFADLEVINFIQSKSKFDISDFQIQEDTEMSRKVIIYYRSLYSMMKYIYLSDILNTYEMKKKYYDIIQSRMTDNELIVILYLLFIDKNINNTRVLSISFKDLLDEAHFFKNLYYSDKNKNFEEFVFFVRKMFPKTAEKSFHFMVLKNQPKNVKTNINDIYKKRYSIEKLFYSDLIYLVILCIPFIGFVIEKVFNPIIPYNTIILITIINFIIYFAIYIIYKSKIFNFKEKCDSIKQIQNKKIYTIFFMRYYIPIFLIALLLLILRFLIP